MIVNGNKTIEVVGLVPDDYEVNATFIGDNFHNEVNATSKVFIVSKADIEMSALNVTVEYGQTVIITVILPEDANDGKVSVNIAGNPYTAEVADGTSLTSYQQRSSKRFS